jgi:hypothetical protein
MRRYSTIIAVAGALGALAVPSAAMAGGNSDAAHACQQGGWQTLVRQDGTGFTNTGNCVSYAASGGALRLKSDLSASGSENFSEDGVGSTPSTFSGGTIDPADYATGENAPGYVPGATVNNGGTGGSILQSDYYFTPFGSGSHFLFTGWGQNSANLTFTNPVKSVSLDAETNKTTVSSTLTLTAYDASHNVVGTNSGFDAGSNKVTLNVTSSTHNIKYITISTDENVDGVHYGLGFTNIVWS